MDTSKVTRVEVIDHTEGKGHLLSGDDGTRRAYINMNLKEVSLSLQDDDCTLKIFVKGIKIMICRMCQREMHGNWADPVWPEDVASINCAGDCVQCMAACGDPDARTALKERGLPYDTDWIPE